MQITFSNFKRYNSELHFIIGNIAASSVKSAKTTVEDITEPTVSSTRIKVMLLCLEVQ